MRYGNNPVFSDKVNEQYLQYDGSMPMTVSGTINKTFLCFLMMAISFGVVFYQYKLGYVDKVNMIFMVSLIAGFILAMIIAFTRKALGILVPIYAFLEGAVLGSISAFAETVYSGIALQAIVGTLGVLGVMLVLFKLNIIRATQRLRSVVFIATVTIALFYLITMIFSFFHISVGSIFFSSTSIGIGFSLLVIAIAALNLIIDFDNIQVWSESGVPKNFEWYGAFGLTVTIVWLYIEILNLLSKMRSR